MKKCLIILLSVLLCSELHSQILATDETDENTGNRIKNTSWETLQNDLHYVVYFRIASVNEVHFLELKLIIGSGKAFAIDQGRELVFTFANNSSIKLYNIEKAVTYDGGGSREGKLYRSTHGLKVRYALSPDDMRALRQNKLKSCRIYTDDGLIEPQKIIKNYHLIVRALEVMGERTSP
ncbi:MAG: hypothetical protein K0B08_04795 [Bacteroidales bacterium]|nr:hypothetical protein [Bacteroidales bacterium]